MDGDINERERINRKSYRDRLHARGLCIRCRQPLEPERADLLICAGCQARQSEYYRARYHKFRDAGLCVSCGKRKAAGGRTMCRPCQIKCSEYQADYRRRHKDDI